MQKGKGRKNQSVPKKKTINKKTEEHIITLGEIFKYNERVKEEKLKIVRECAKTGDLTKLKDLKNFDEGTIEVPLLYSESDMDRSFYDGFDAGCEAVRQKGLISKNMRISKSTMQKRAMFARKAQYVIDAYIRMVNNEKAVLKELSENKMAKRIKEYTEPLLKNQAVKGKLILTRKSDDRFRGLSTQTIKNILRSSNKISYYPWKKNPSKT